ncbi:leucine-rich repeat and fibronectin type III domain-containing protein 1-like protein isoform X2 [Atheta coriaria]|uniref:leucine-rich repeat and fibronectin type III domain-containing protein 1-like protein isoform X2 n=1 Tax=Dalotia coriaria TaxID=877792 RepID=UPI0031F3EC7D
MKMKQKSAVVLIALVMLISSASAQCPWQREVVDLQSACLCSYNLGHELSIQCDIVEWPKLITSMHKYAKATPIDLLYVNNSTIGTLKDSIFAGLEVHNIQMSGCKLKTIGDNAFKGQEKFLKNLNLQDNDLTEVPVQSLKDLKSLQLLDLSRNRIANVPNAAFQTLIKLTTLKLSDNNVTLANEALKGLESSLKNLNLKGTRQKEIPQAVRGMKTLAFLDLSQNSIRELPGEGGIKTFEGLDALTALNLERNLIQTLGQNAFYGVRRTLSSLSLLNNLLPDFPIEAMQELSELRVLDIGFNLLTDLPVNSFVGNPSITLLALDGNPLATIPYAGLSHLNNTLRGLSLGGRFLHCDCRLAWVIDWIRNGDLQVTSRERNPQFCGSPPKFRDRGFYSIQPEELTCNGPHEAVGVATVVTAELDDVSVAETMPVKTTAASTTTTKNPEQNTTTTTSTTSTTKKTTTTQTTTSSTTAKSVKETTTTSSTTQKVNNRTLSRGSTIPPWRTNQSQQQVRPNLVMGFPSRNKADEEKEVIVKSAYRQDNSVIINWGSETANILGFRVVYRLFGDKSFKQGPPLEASEREFKIKNVPSQECIVVCVVSLEDINVTPETVPYAQCREVRTVSSAASNMDKITIAASAAICGTIVIAVIIFIAASRRRSRKLHELHQQKLGIKTGLPIGGLPVNCCAAASPGGPLSSLATLNAYNSNKDWDQVSAYSTHSTQRPRMYSVEPSSLMQDDLRSHFSTKGTKPRSIADGQSQHSFSNHSGRYLAAANAFPNNLLASRQDLRQSRQSLAMQSERMPRGTQHHLVPSHHAPPTHSVTSSTRRSRPRSRSRDHHRPSSRYSTAGSTHTLNNYCDNSDNWTDHDMEIYMARNQTRNGLVPL